MQKTGDAFGDSFGVKVLDEGGTFFHGRNMVKLEESMNVAGSERRYLILENGDAINKFLSLHKHQPTNGEREGFVP
jgi:hypothetical protein